MNWSTDPCSIAEVFVQTGWKTTNINLHDVSTCLSIWDRYKNPDPSKQVDHTSLIGIATALRKTRNDMTHDATLTMNEPRTATIFTQIQNVLSHLLIVKSVPNLREITTKIYDFEQDCTKCKIIVQMLNMSASTTVLNLKVTSYILSLKSRLLFIHFNL